MLHGIRFTLPYSPETTLLLDWLRYSGVIRLETPNDLKMSTTTVTLWCPRGVSDQKAWAEANVKRIESFGICSASIAVAQK